MNFSNVVAGVRFIAVVCFVYCSYQLSVLIPPRIKAWNLEDEAAYFCACCAAWFLLKK